MGIMLNSNIRCIEMKVSPTIAELEAMLNSNIRCIEMYVWREGVEDDDGLNSNIRCIEISFRLINYLRIYR